MPADPLTCPNTPSCGHGLHDIYELGDPYPTCCVEGCRCGHPGDAETVMRIDGTVIVRRADPVIRVSKQLLDAELLPEHWDPESETLTLDTARKYRYRYLRPDPTDPRALIFGRITEEQHREVNERG